MELQFVYVRKEFISSFKCYMTIELELEKENKTLIEKGLNLYFNHNYIKVNFKGNGITYLNFTCYLKLLYLSLFMDILNGSL